MAEVEILLATYKPDMVYLQKLLQSIGSQTHQSIQLSVIDDSADEPVFQAVSDLIRAEIKAIPVKIAKNEKNLGSTKTFERLTREAECRYVAYCDQDDIWEDDKIEKLVAGIREENAVLCYSDLSIIDENDRLTAKSFQQVNRRIRHVRGEGLFRRFLRRNSANGCTMLIRSDIAKQALPFCDAYYIHDHWLMLYASSAGRIAYVNQPLVRYRIHGGNQIGSKKLAGIADRHSYLSQKLDTEAAKFEYLLSAGIFQEARLRDIEHTLRFVQVRRHFFSRRSPFNTMKMLCVLPQDPQLILFELFLAFAPAVLSRKVIKALQ